MPQYDYDLIVIGAGSAGIRAARLAAKFGAHVAVVETSDVGGTCVNVGCVPKKLFVYAAEFGRLFELAKGFGWQVNQPEFIWQQLLANKNNEVARLGSIYQQRLDDLSIDTIAGNATLVSPHTVNINEHLISATRILIATGSLPVIPDISGNQHVISSNEVFFLSRLPERLLIIGGGYIAVEFASIFNRLGVDVTLIYRKELLLSGFDEELSQKLAVAMQENDIQLKPNCTVKEISAGLTAQLSDGTVLAADTILAATGRRPNTTGLGLAAIDVALDSRGGICVNQHYQTTVPSIYAIGDVINRVQLTPVAIAEAEFLIHSWYQQATTAIDYTQIPTCVFSEPNVGSVGLSEMQAREQYQEIAVYRSTFKPMQYAFFERDVREFIKLVIDKSTGRVVGAHLLGAHAGEIIQGISIAMKAGATKQDFDNTLGIHPTVAEEFVTM